jgi:8-oxo-dGTP pyrophosphatase MutT (NUDIX family)
MTPSPPPKQAEAMDEVRGGEAEQAARAAAQRVEVVDAEGNVERTVPRSEMRSGRLRHRCTYIAVIDHDDRLVVHQRAPWKDVWPSRWDIAFGGVADPGEAWEDAARRELEEEAGLTTEDGGLVEVGVGAYDDDAVSLLGHAYVIRTDEPVRFDDGEVVAADRIPLDEVEAWLATHETCPDSVHFLAAALTRLGKAGSADN